MQGAATFMILPNMAWWQKIGIAKNTVSAGTRLKSSRLSIISLMRVAIVSLFLYFALCTNMQTTALLHLCTIVTMQRRTVYVTRTYVHTANTVRPPSNEIPILSRSEHESHAMPCTCKCLCCVAANGIGRSIISRPEKPLL